MPSSTRPAGEFRLLLDEAIPVLPACELMLAMLDGDRAKVRRLRENADPEALTDSLLKLCTFLGVAAYGSGQRAQIALLAMHREWAGEEGIPGD